MVINTDAIRMAARVFGCFVIGFIIGVALTYVFGKKIEYHTHNTYHQEQYQNQSQAQIVITPFTAGGSLAYTEYTTSDLTAKYGSVARFLGTLNPIESLFSRSSPVGHGSLLVPQFVKDDYQKKQ